MRGNDYAARFERLSVCDGEVSEGSEEGEKSEESEKSRELGRFFFNVHEHGSLLVLGK